MKRYRAFAVLTAFLVVLAGAQPAYAAAPTVSLTAPAAGATVSGVITLDVTTSSNTDKVEYFVDGVEVAEDLTNNGNWSEEWDTNSVSDGAHLIHAKATNTDDPSSTTTADRSFTVGNHGTPANGLGAPTLNADTNADKSVDLVWTPVPGAASYHVYEDLYNPANGVTPLATVTDTKSRRGPLANGTYRYFVTPVDSAGAEGTPSNKFTIKVPAPEDDPELTFNTPATNATLSGTVDFTATCTDTATSSDLCDKVDYLIDGQLAADDAAGGNTDGFTEQINTASYADGKHYIQARGWNGTISKTSSPRAVTFDNGTTPPDGVAPTAAFSATPGSGSGVYDFHDQSTGAPTSWSWDFGDSSAAVTTQHPSHTYTAPGTYTVMLTATNAHGSDTESKTITVDSPPAAGTVVANFSVAKTGNRAYQFTDTSTGSPTSWSWNFGDAATSTAQNPAHTYATAGTYTVTLSASNSSSTSTFQRDIVVTDDPAPTKTDLRPSLPGTTGDNTMVDITAGEQVKFNGNWYVDNANSGGNVTIKWYVDGVERGTITYTPQPPGAYGSQSAAAWTATEGNHVVEMRMDPGNTIAEESETNNSSTRSFTVAPAPTTGNPPAIPASGPVPASAETAQFASGTGDIADDPAIWVNPTDPSRSVVIGSKKAASGGGLGVYDLEGNQIQFLAAGELNNVDIRTVNGKVVVLTTERGGNTLMFFYLDPATRTLSAAGSFATGFEPYGGCLYQNGSTLYGFVTNRASPFDFDQYQLTVGSSAVTGSKVRDITTSSLSEGCVADDEGGYVFLSQETSGIYRYSASPSGGTSRTTVATVGSNGLTADVEGIAIARGRGATHPDHIVVSSQGASTYQVFDLASPHTFRKSFTVTAGGGADAVTGTDGLDITRTGLGTFFPNGLLVVHDDTNSGGTMSNFKLVDAGLVLGAYTTDGGGTDPEPNPTDRGPRGPVLVWEDDFEAGLNCNIWTRMQNNDTGPNGTLSSTCSSLPSSGTSRGSFPESGGEAGTGDRAFRAEVRQGDVGAGSGERSELSGDGSSWSFGEGYEGWLQERIRVEPGLVQEQNGRFYILNQWHAGAGSPPLRMDIQDDGSLTIGSNGSGTVADKTILTAAEFTQGTWFDIDIHFKMSIDPAKGGVEVWVNGVQKVTWTAGQTMADNGSYLKIGQYRDSQPSTGVVFFDDVRLTRR